MADIKVGMEQREQQHAIVEAPGTEEEEVKPQKTKRVASLDIFRGLTVALMVLVDDAGGDWPMIGHAPWNGCNLADFVMPFFLFIVGMAIALALKKIPEKKVAISKVILRTLKLLFWGLLLQGQAWHWKEMIFFSMRRNGCERNTFIQNERSVMTSGNYFPCRILDCEGGYSHAPDKLTYGVDMNRIRWCGILQRIALAYLIVAIIEISTKAQSNRLPTGWFSIFKLYYLQWVIGACVLIVYLATLYGTYVPDWHFVVKNPNSIDFGKTLTVTCNMRGNLDPPCNAVGYIDRQVLGINHMYPRPAWKRSKACTKNSPYEGPFRDDAPSWCFAPFEPEGILSTISAILSTVIGVHFGHVLIDMKDHSSRLLHWVVMGLALLVLGIALHFTDAIPLNKQLYTFSYVCVTSGAAALVFSAFYILVDILNLNYVFLPLQWIGMNAMLVYVMAAGGIFAGFINGWYYEDPHNTLIYWIKKHIFIGVWHSRRVGVLLYVIFAEILFWAIVAGLLHWLGIYWKL